MMNSSSTKQLQMIEAAPARPSRAGIIVSLGATLAWSVSLFASTFAHAEEHRSCEGVFAYAASPRSLSSKTSVVAKTNEADLGAHASEGKVIYLPVRILPLFSNLPPRELSPAHLGRDSRNFYDVNPRFPVIAYLLDQNSVRLLSLATGRVVKTFKPKFSPSLQGLSDDIEQIRYTNNGQLLIAFTRDGRSSIHFADSSQGPRSESEAVPSLSAASEAIDARISPDGTRILTTPYGGAAKLWDAKSGALVSELQSDSPILSASFNEDGSRFLTHELSGKLTLWSTSSLEPLQTFGSPKTIASARFIDRDRVLTIDSAGQALIWEQQR